MTPPFATIAARFAILLRQLSEPSEVAAFAERILDDLERPVTLNSVTLHVRGSMGIARYPDDGEDVGTLLRHADAAMYSAKRSHRRREFFVSGRTTTARAGWPWPAS